MKGHLDARSGGKHDDHVNWAQAGPVIGALTAVVGVAIGLQSFWIARSFDPFGTRCTAGFGRLDTRLDRLEGPELPSSSRA